MSKLYVIASLFLTATIALAQTAGEITGEVKDPSGASTPNATITATNKDTNVARTTTSNTAGVYSFPALIPGTYDVKAGATGFETTVVTNVLLQVQQSARVDFTLTVGQASQTVEVSASGELLSTENASTGTVIEQRRITDLPLNGRNFFSLVALSPGVTVGFAPAAQAANRQGGSRAGLTMSLSGSRATWANYTLDGVTNTDINFNLYVVLPSVDALQEFKVQQGIYSAEFGREAGQINVSTRPGTNGFHGTAFDFLRNDALDAKNYDFIGTSPAKSPFRQNQYGYTLGGPVWIPKLFNGKNRLFFMSNYEALRARTTRVSTATTITQAMRDGNFSAVPTQLRDPLTRTGTGAAATAAPFAGNQIPVSRFDKNSLFLLNAYNPLPNITQTTPGIPNQNYQYLAKTPLDKDQVTERIDFNESSNSQWFGRYSWTDESQISPGLTKDGSTLYTRASQWVIANTRILSSTKVNEARFGYNSLFNVIGQELGNTEDVNAKLAGFPVKITDPASWGIPNIGLINNLTSFGNATSSPFTIDNKTYQAVDNFSWIIGKHSLRLGGEYRYNKFPQLGNEFPRGQFQFNGSYTAEPVNLSGGYSGADFLLGNFFRADIAVALANGDFRNSEWAGYVDDTWKIKPHLTLSLGLRYEVAQPLKDVAGNSVSFQLKQSLPNGPELDPNKHPVYVRTGTGNFYDNLAFRYTAANSTGVLGSTVLTARDGRLGDRLVNTDYNNFAPRFGIAWSPNDKWSVRTGFGIFFSQESKNSIFDLNRGLGGRTGVTPDQRAKPQFDYTNFLNPSALPATIPISLTWGVDNNLRTTYSMSYLLNVQRVLGKGTTLEVGYAGSQSRKLGILSNENAPTPGITSFASRAPYPELLGIQYLRGDAISNYNGMASKLTQRFGTNLTTLFSYTWSKSLDDASAIRGQGNEFAPQDMRCRSCEYGPSTFNIPHRFVSSVLYTLPFGKGQRFLNHGGVLDRVVGGWQVSTIFTMQNGAPIDTTSWDSAGTSFVPASTRLNCTGAASYVNANPTANQYFNVAAFANSVAGTYGTCGRNNLRGPRQVNTDFSAIKDFHITERQALQFRLEMFNAVNHVELAGPNANWGNQNAAPAAPATSFGQIRGTLTSMRQMQMALKYNF